MRKKQILFKLNWRPTKTTTKITSNAYLIASKQSDKHTKRWSFYTLKLLLFLSSSAYSIMESMTCVFIVQCIFHGTLNVWKTLREFGGKKNATEYKNHQENHYYYQRFVGTVHNRSIILFTFLLLLVVV